jgi:hypothetical protein
MRKHCAVLFIGGGIIVSSIADYAQSRQMSLLFCSGKFDLVNREGKFPSIIFILYLNVSGSKLYEIL